MTTGTAVIAGYDIRTQLRDVSSEYNKVERVVPPCPHKSSL